MVYTCTCTCEYCKPASNKVNMNQKNLLHSLLSPPQAVLHAHPYHIDSLLQLSEVCKMSEDLQMAAELIGKSHDYHVTLI